MKKILPSILVLVLFSVVFLLLFHSCASATDALKDSGSKMATGEEMFLDELSTQNAEESDAISTEWGESATEQQGISTNENESATEQGEASTDEGLTSMEIRAITTEKGEISTEKFEKSELKEYLEERILPVIIGVLTAVSALCATLFKIRRSLLKIKEARDDFKSEAKARDESFKRQSELLRVKSEELSNIALEIPKLKEQICELEKSTGKVILECGYISQMISLGFGESKDVIKSGSGSKISRLEKECRVISEGDKDEDILK